MTPNQESKIVITEELNAILNNARNEAYHKKMKIVTTTLVAKHLFKSSPFVSLLIQKGVSWDKIQLIQLEIEQFLEKWNKTLIISEEEKIAQFKYIERQDPNYFKNEINAHKDLNALNFTPDSSYMLNRIDKKATSLAMKNSSAISSLLFFYTVLDESSSDLKNICFKYGITSDSVKKTFNIEQNSAHTNTYIKEYTINMNSKVKEEKKSIFHREKDLNLLFEVLNRKEKNSAIIVGNAGVGKTVLIEEIARQVNKNNVPEILKNSLVLSLNISALVAGSKYRGEFEERLDNLIEEIQSLGQTVIFVIDDLQIALNTGGMTGLDFTLYLKKIMSISNIKLITTTSFESYRKTIEKDSSLIRRLHKIELDELTEIETLDVLKYSKKMMESDYKIKIPDSLLDYTVKISKKYLLKKKFPDKAIDILDQASAKVNFNKQKNMTVNDIDSVVSVLTKIPLESLTVREVDKVRHLKESLAVKIFGQDEAIDKIYQSLLVSKTGLREDNKPIASFLFTGPTGVGKTELAIQLSKEMGINFVRFDMSEFMEAHTVSKLIGAPPGYIGYDKGGELTEQIEQKPYSVLLLDEIEKAHHEVYNVLLQVMDNGFLSDGQGRKADFRNVILILTSNIGAQAAQQTALGFSTEVNAKGKREKEINKKFAPEFLNRLDAIVEFNKISKTVALKIIQKNIKELQDILREKKINLKINDDVYEFLANKGFDEKMGARPLKRIIDQTIKTPLASFIIDKEHDLILNLLITIDDDSVKVRKE